MRYALYFTPPMSDPLARVAANWLGRNPFSGEYVLPPAIGHMTVDEIDRHTQMPRRYGFHATIKAPFHLSQEKDEAALLSAIMNFCGDLAPFALPPLRISRLGPFFALTPSEPSRALQDFANAVVREFEPYRAPLSTTEMERRNPQKLTERQRDYLARFGYPYVFEEFRFHMTLTGPVAEAEAAQVDRALHDFFEPVLSEPVNVANLALFIEPEHGEAFFVDSLHPLGRISSKRRTSGLAAAN
jgi:putative phosphonate metabolism protein